MKIQHYAFHEDSELDQPVSLTNHHGGVHADTDQEQEMVMGEMM